MDGQHLSLAISEYRKLPELSVDEENAHFYRLMQEIGKKYDDL